AVELRRRVEIVVVVVEARGLELLRLSFAQHAERAAGLEAQRLHRADHVEHGRELALPWTAPGRAHAEARRTRVARRTGGIDHGLDLEHRLGFHTRVVARRLGTVA